MSKKTLAQLVKEQHARLTKAMLPYAGSDAEDAVQEAWLWLAEHPEKEPSGPTAYRLAKNRAFHIRRTEEREQARREAWRECGWSTGTKRVTGDIVKCQTPGCARRPQARGVCSACYKRMRRLEAANEPMAKKETA